MWTSATGARGRGPLMGRATPTSGTWPPRGYESVFTMAADGSDPERITSEPVHHSLPQWSPDGRYIAVPSKGYPWLVDVLAHDFETGRRIRLTSEGGIDEEAPAGSFRYH